MYPQSPPPLAHHAMTPPLPRPETPVRPSSLVLTQSSIRSRHLNSPRPRPPLASIAVPILSPTETSNRSSGSSYEIATPSPRRSRSELLPGITLDVSTRPRSEERNEYSPPPLPSPFVTKTPATPPREDRTPKRNSTQRRLDALRGLVADLDFNQPWSTSRPTTPAQTPLASSGYSKSLEPVSPLRARSWRSELSREQHEQLDPLDTQRIEIMWEMCETERAFLRSMQTVLRLFATPLRTPQGEWISGIPEPITELLDHLESLTLAHGLLAAALRDFQKSLDLDELAQLFQQWSPRLHEHEWYLIHFEPVVALVEDSARDDENVFGEFVRMQTKAEDMGAMSLGSMLLKPVQRLMKYPLFWKRLLEITPRQHPSHAGLASVLAETESIILTLQSSKAKEEDYQEVVNLEKRLVFDDEFQLAVRGRKLLGQGVVTRVQGKELVPVTLGRTSSLSSRGSVSSISSFWDTRNSVVSSQSSCSRSGSIKGVPRSPSSTSITERRRRDELQMFVFDDLVVLATLREGIFKKRDRTWKVLPEHEGGFGKLIEVKDWSGWGGHSTLFTLTFPLTTVCLSLPPAPKTKISLSCPFLMTMPQVMSVLAQTTESESVEELECLGYAS